MFNKLYFLLLLFGTINQAYFVTIVNSEHYDPTWESLDKRPLPAWYNEAKIGIFLHWGVFSVPSFHSEWFWNDWVEGNKEIVSYMKKNYHPGFTYQDFARDFTAEFFDATQWTQLFEKSGAKYVVLTSKHHEGYTLWPSKYAYSWNSMDVGPHRDLIGELSKAVKKTSLKFGVYHSLYEWYNPLYLADKMSNFTKNNFVEYKILPEMVELVQSYSPEILWSDGDWEANDTYWKSTDFLSWLYNESPVKDTVVVNDRWGRGIMCHHGDFYTCSDRYNPGVLQLHKWENAMTIDKKSWGFRRNANIEDIYTIEELLKILAETVSCGGNLLLNVGPTRDGIISPIYQEKLLQLGTWLHINGEAVYGSLPWKYQNDSISNVWYTSKHSTVYAIVLKWPTDDSIQLGYVYKVFSNTSLHINLLGDKQELKWSFNKNKSVMVKLPNRNSVVSDWAWVLKITSGKKLK